MATKAVTQASVEFGPGMSGSRCGICIHYNGPNDCDLVMSQPKNITAQTWCDQFNKDQSKVMYGTAK